jgi:hypothetical protein
MSISRCLPGLFSKSAGFFRSTAKSFKFLSYAFGDGSQLLGSLPIHFLRQTMKLRYCPSLLHDSPVSIGLDASSFRLHTQSFGFVA